MGISLQQMVAEWLRDKHCKLRTIPLAEGLVHGSTAVIGLPSLDGCLMHSLSYGPIHIIPYGYVYDDHVEITKSDYRFDELRKHKLDACDPTFFAKLDQLVRIYESQNEDDTR